MKNDTLFAIYSPLHDRFYYEFWGIATDMSRNIEIRWQKDYDKATLFNDDSVELVWDYVHQNIGDLIDVLCQAGCVIVPIICTDDEIDWSQAVPVQSLTSYN